MFLDESGKFPWAYKETNISVIWIYGPCLYPYFCVYASNSEHKKQKARFEYELLDTYTAGIVLAGTEIKSLRNGRASISESFCEFNDKSELFIINMQIDEYSHASHFNHRPKAERKLLLNKRELGKLEKEVKTSGLTIVPLKVFINDRGLAKMTIALAKGKKLYDKRETIKDRDNKRNLDRIKKSFNN